MSRLPLSVHTRLGRNDIVAIIHEHFENHIGIDLQVSSVHLPDGLMADVVLLIPEAIEGEYLHRAMGQPPLPLEPAEGEDPLPELNRVPVDPDQTHPEPPLPERLEIVQDLMGEGRLFDQRVTDIEEGDAPPGYVPPHLRRLGNLSEPPDESPAREVAECLAAQEQAARDEGVRGFTAPDDVDRGRRRRSAENPEPADEEA